MVQSQPQLTLPGEQWVLIPHPTGDYQLPYTLYLLVTSVIADPAYSNLSYTFNMSDGQTRIVSATNIIRNAILELAAEHPVFSSPTTFNIIAGFITPQFLVDLQASLHDPENARWIWAEPRFAAENADRSTSQD